MPQAAVKLIWSMASCNFCPRSDVRTCQIKPGKLLSKLSSALDLDVSLLDHSEGICTCCLADIDMIIRSVAIRGAMKDYFMDLVEKMKSYGSGDKGQYFNGHQGKSITSPPQQGVDDQSSHSINAQQDTESTNAPPPPTLVARPPFPNDSSISEKSEIPTEVLPLPSPASPISTVTVAKKTKERMTRYQCILCDKIAGSKSHCMEHLICHSPVRPFTCSHCMRTYKSRKACREHLIVMHGVEKVEENLQRLVLVDHDDLKQLEHVCTQYRRIYRQGTTKVESTTPAPIQSFKSEPTGEADGGSAWLFKPPPGTPARLPPPLLQCMPSTFSPQSALTADSKLCDETEPTPPPSKRNRKGKPHKLVHDSPPSETDPDASVKREILDDSFDNHDEDGNEKKMLEQLANVDDAVFPSNEPLSLDNMSQPFFPSFQQCKVEPSLPVVSSYSPTGISKKAQPPCKVCGRQFPTKEKMADHMRSHSEIKQFSCLVCNRFFKYRRGVTNHLKEVHHMTDRMEISSKVASHEIGSIIQTSLKRERKSSSIKRFAKDELAESNISEKVIQDTLSSLADMQQATDSVALQLQISSDDSASILDADDSTFLVGDHSSSNDNSTSYDKVMTSDAGSAPNDSKPTLFSAFPDLPPSNYNWSSVDAAFADVNQLSTPSSGALPNIPTTNTAAGLNPITCANMPLVD